MSIADNNRNLVLYANGHPVPVATARCRQQPTSKTVQALDGSRPIQLDPDEPLAWLHLGLPFFGEHSAATHVSTGEPFCMKTYLLLGMSSNCINSSAQLFVIRWSCDNDINSCDHRIDLNSTMNHSGGRVVALLAGWKPTSSSLGSVVAISSDGHRIAAARWNLVLIWTICPDMLSQGPFEPYFPARDFNRRKDFGRIRPVRLPAQGVVHSLHWVDRENLFALTDRGLIRWYIGHSRSGKREI